MSTMIRWESGMYQSSKTGDYIADVPDIGRYVAARTAPRARTWILKLNGVKIAGPFGSRDAAMEAAR